MGTGLLYLFTLGGLGFSWITDVFVLNLLVFQTNQLVDHFNQQEAERRDRFGARTILDGDFSGYQVEQVCPTQDDGEPELAFGAE